MMKFLQVSAVLLVAPEPVEAATTNGVGGFVAGDASTIPAEWSQCVNVVQGDLWRTPCTAILDPATNGNAWRVPIITDGLPYVYEETFDGKLDWDAKYICEYVLNGTDNLPVACPPPPDGESYDGTCATPEQYDAVANAFTNGQAFPDPIGFNFLGFAWDVRQFLLQPPQIAVTGAPGFVECVTEILLYPNKDVSAQEIACTAIVAADVQPVLSQEDIDQGLNFPSNPTVDDYRRPICDLILGNESVLTVPDAKGLCASLPAQPLTIASFPGSNSDPAPAEGLPPLVWDVGGVFCPAVALL